MHSNLTLDTEAESVIVIEAENLQLALDCGDGVSLVESQSLMCIHMVRTVVLFAISSRAPHS